MTLAKTPLRSLALGLWPEIHRPDRFGVLDPDMAGVYVVDMTKTTKRVRLGAMAFGLAALLILAAACSSGVRDEQSSNDANRGAASGTAAWPGPAGCENSPTNLDQYAMFGARGYPNCNININAYCNDAVSFYGLPDISLCFALTNKTKKFTAPDTLGSKFPLTLSNAYCESYRQSGSVDSGYLDDQGLCTSTSGYRGSIRVYSTGSVFPNQARLLNPNPFMETAAVQFMPHRQSTGPAVRIFVSSLMAPYNSSQKAAQPEAESPFSGTNGGNCDTQGEYLSCRLTNTIESKSWNPRGNFDISNYPLRMQVKNSSGRPMRLTSGGNGTAGSGLLIDPVSLKAVTEIPSGETAFIGGYLKANVSDEEMSWTGSYCIEQLSGACVNVDVTFKLKFTSDKDAANPSARNYANASTCIVDARSAATTYKCNTPSFNNSVESPLLTANITNF